MIVCSCNAIREQELRLAARQGGGEVEAVYARLGCEVNCGQCVPFALEIIEEESCVPA
ncbi:MAG: (2Fe-2S)-binding protein [Sphingomonadales bacterium]|nr:(2Fe-2S)-binding protein [Sphingomonadaceae bacterium]MBS3932297.1 (2Fe-2S)-binding protein [Sphingomonadales bacterium]